MVWDKNPEVRAATIRALDDLKAIQSIPTLLAALGADESAPSDAKELAKTVANLKVDDSTIDALLREGTPKQRRGVLLWIGLSGDWRTHSPAVCAAIGDEDRGILPSEASSSSCGSTPGFTGFF
jgi:hypothetical protein